MSEGRAHIDSYLPGALKTCQAKCLLDPVDDPSRSGAGTAVSFAAVASVARTPPGFHVRRLQDLCHGLIVNWPRILHHKQGSVVRLAVVAA